MTSNHFQRTCLGLIRRAEEVKKDVFPIVFLVFLCVSASSFPPLRLLKEYYCTHMCNTMLHGWLCQKSRRILSVSFSVMCILPRFGVMSFFSDLSSCCKCHGHVMDMSWTCMLHDACMMPACASSHDMSCHHPNIHYSPLGIQPNSTDHS